MTGIPGAPTGRPDGAAAEEPDPAADRARRGVRIAGLVALAVIAVAGMLRLSLWQWDKARAHDSLLNYTYAVEWALFAVLTVAGLARLVVEDARLSRAAHEADPDPEPAATRPGGPVIGPPLLPGEELEEITWVRLRRRAGLDRRA